MTLLVAALATQRVIAQVSDGASLRTELTQVVGGARQFARRLQRKEERPTRSVLNLSPRLSLTRLRVLVERLIDQAAPLVLVSHWLCRLPPPALA